MPSRATAFSRSACALLLLTACTWLVEIAALVVLWRNQILAPYAFFPNQAYDFLAKIRWYADPVLGWAPGLPDRFAGLPAIEKISALAALLPATLATALVLALLGGVLAALQPRLASSLRRAIVGWMALGLLVHVAVSLPAFGLDEGLRLGRLAFRARSLIVDGMLLATAVSLVAALLAWALAPRFERSRVSGAVGVLLMIVLAGAASTLAGPTVVSSDPTPLPTPDTTRPQRNIILISLDSLRADHVGAYGYKRPTSPNFDGFAKQGVLFRNAISTSSWTLPTHLTMFTGRSQVSHGVTVDTKVLSTSIPTLGEIFHEAGYATAGFVSGPYVGGHYGYARGMDTYEDLSEKWGKSAEARAAILSPAINEKALAWLDQDHKQPFFLFLHYFDIHYDFVPPAPYDTMFDPDYTGTMDGHFFIERDDVHKNMPARDLDHIRALYDGEIRFTDEHVGRVLDRLRDKGLLDSTVVMITADHGDEFFEHGNKGHHRTVYDEVTRIPMAIRLPGEQYAGQSVEEQASLIDVFPTLLDAAGLTPPKQAEGLSLLDGLRGETSNREEIYSDFYDKRGFNLQVARRTASGKTIEHFNRITHPKRGPLEYYDLSTDPGERTNLSPGRPQAMTDSLPPMTAWLQSQWTAQQSAAADGHSSVSLELDEETKQRLESLGYVGE